MRVESDGTVALVKGHGYRFGSLSVEERGCGLE